jgi:hypothetical protein
LSAADAVHAADVQLHLLTLASERIGDDTDSIDTANAFRRST